MCSGLLDVKIPGKILLRKSEQIKGSDSPDALKVAAGATCTVVKVQHLVVDDGAVSII